MSERWTSAQREAIEHVRGDLLVSAAAGSGKTAVLAERCARLVCEIPEQDGGCGVEALLVLTFTEAAANEMRGRIAEAIRAKLKSQAGASGAQSARLRRQAAMVDRASISTLHGFCARVLRQHFHAATIDPAFEVMDEDEARLVREDVLTDLLARWHRKNPPAAGGEQSAFVEFMEAYAQGRESTCRDMILSVYRMLSSTADPAAYKAASRALYAPEGRAVTVERYVRNVVDGKLRLLELTARRGVDEVKAAGISGVMLAELQKALGEIEAARKVLCAKGAAGLPAAREAMQHEWPKLYGPRGMTDFKPLKDRTWQAVKDKMNELYAEELAANADEMVLELAGLARPLETLLELVDEFVAEYAAVKRSQNRLDFSDLERFTLNVLAAPGSLAAVELRARYRHLLVDEFQDINPLQAALLETLRSSTGPDGAGNLFVVGDVKQSIYGFRLAEPALFLEREKTARLANKAGAHRYVGLPHNFRSHPNLLVAMNGFFDRLLTLEMTGINYSDGHALQPPPVVDSSKKSTADAALLNGAPVEVLLLNAKGGEDLNEGEEKEGGEGREEAADVAEEKEDLSVIDAEARMVAERIVQLIAQGRRIKTKDGELRPLKYRDIAILLRGMKNKALLFARALARRGVPVHADLSTGYFDAPEVRDTLALLQVLDNPLQDIPLATALLGPYGRFSHDDVARIRLGYPKKEVSFCQAVTNYAAGDDASAARNAAEGGADIPPFDPDLAQRLHAFLEKLAGWRSRLRTRPLHEGLAEIFAAARIMPYMSGLDAGAQRVANLQALHQRALKFSGFRKQGLHRFLRFIEKLRQQEADFGEAPVLSEASNVVRILSVHKSKGLEFPVVFVSGLGGKMNLRDIGPVHVHRDLFIGLQVADVEQNIFYHSAVSAGITDANKRSGRAEELRLLYVALTRARDYLILTGHVNKADQVDTVRKQWGGWRHGTPLPEDVLLRATTPLHWLLPAMACSGLQVCWPDDAQTAACQVAVTLHAPRSHDGRATETGAAATVEIDDAGEERDRRLLAAEPLDLPVLANPSVDRLVTRVTGTYEHETLAHQPAVMTVTELKKLEDRPGEGAPKESAQIAPVQAFAFHAQPMRTQGAEESRQRGVATHRLLELLDFTSAAGAEAVADQIAKLVETRALSAEEACRVDREGVLWVAQSACGRRAAAGQGRAEAAACRARGESAVEVRREIPFVWAAPISEAEAGTDPADWPTIRGVIDLLLVDVAAKEAEIVDYKTDSAFTWQANAISYQRQMRYYLRAASAILGFPVKKATLLFLSPREERIVTLD